MGGTYPTVVIADQILRGDKVVTATGVAWIGGFWGALFFLLAAHEVLLMPTRTNRGALYLAASGAGWLLTGSQLCGLVVSAIQESVLLGTVTVLGVLGAVGFLLIIRPIRTPTPPQPFYPVVRFVQATVVVIVFLVGMRVTDHVLDDHLGERQKLVFLDVFGVSSGTPIYYRGVTVGQVERVSLSEADLGVEVQFVLEGGIRTCPALTIEVAADLLAMRRYLELVADQSCDSSVQLTDALLTPSDTTKHPPVDQAVVDLMEDLRAIDLRTTNLTLIETLSSARASLDTANLAAAEVTKLVQGPGRRTLREVDGALQQSTQTLGAVRTTLARVDTVLPKVDGLLTSAETTVREVGGHTQLTLGKLDCFASSMSQLDGALLMERGLQIRFRNVPKRKRLAPPCH